MPKPVGSTWLLQAQESNITAMGHLQASLSSSAGFFRRLNEKACKMLSTEPGTWKALTK